MLITLVILGGCQKDSNPLTLNQGILQTEKSDPNLTQVNNDTSEIVKVKTLFESPTGTVDSFELFLLAHHSFQVQLESFLNEGRELLALESFTGIILGHLDNELNFKAYYENGEFVQDITEEDQLRIGPVCYNIYMITETVTEWWQVTELNGVITYTYLGQGPTTVTTELIGETCTGPGFDEYYMNSVVNQVYITQTQAMVRLGDMLIEEGIELIDLCNPENDTNHEIIESVVNNTNLEVITEQAFWEAYQSYLEDCLEIEIDCTNDINIFECIEDEIATILPYSCKSFNFEDFGLFQVARLSGVKFNFINSANGSAAFCDFNVEIAAPNFIELTSPSWGNLSALPITPGMAANAAADAINQAIDLTVEYYGDPNTYYNNSQCETFQEYFQTYFNIIFAGMLALEVSDTYNLGVDEFVLEIEPLLQIGYSNLTGITPTIKVGDFSIFGFGKDNCN